MVCTIKRRVGSIRRQTRNYVKQLWERRAFQFVLVVVAVRYLPRVVRSLHQRLHELHQCRQQRLRPSRRDFLTCKNYPSNSHEKVPKMGELGHETLYTFFQQKASEQACQVWCVNFLKKFEKWCDILKVMSLFIDRLPEFWQFKQKCSNNPLAMI